MKLVHQAWTSELEGRLATYATASHRVHPPDHPLEARVTRLHTQKRHMKHTQIQLRLKKKRGKVTWPSTIRIQDKSDRRESALAFCILVL